MEINKSILIINQLQFSAGKMPKRGRPRKINSLFTVKNFIEYTSDSDSDVENVQHNVSYEIQQGSLQSIGRNAEPQEQQEQQQPQEQVGESIVTDEENLVGEDSVQVGEDVSEQVGESIVTDDEDIYMEIIPHQQEQQHQRQQEENVFADERPANNGEQQEHQHQRQQEENVFADEQPAYNGEQQEHQHQRQQEENVFADERPAYNGEQREQQEENVFADERPANVNLSADEESEISDDEQDDRNMNEDQNFDEILEDIKSKWLLTENKHCVSKKASEAFWRIAAQHFPKLATARGKKRIPQFKTIRGQMHNDLLPPVELEIAYRNKNTGEIEIVKDTITPRKRFSPTNYEKLFDIGTIKVRFNILLHFIISFLI